MADVELATPDTSSPPRSALDRPATTADVEQVQSTLQAEMQEVRTELRYTASKADLARVETALQHTVSKADLARVETALQHTASKADLERVETARQDTASKADLARVETVLQHTASKADLAQVTKDLHTQLLIFGVGLAALLVACTGVIVAAIALWG